MYLQIQKHFLKRVITFKATYYMASTVLEFLGIKYEERIRLTSLSYRWENGASLSGAAQPSSHHEAAEPEL